MKSPRPFKKLFIISGTIAACLSGTVLMTGCKTAMVIGAVAGAVTIAVVVAKYKASAEQKAAAEQRAHAVMARTAQPRIERKRAQVRAASQKKTADIEAKYARRIAQSQGASAAQLEAEKKREIEKAQSQSTVELAALDREWSALGGTAPGGLKADATPAGTAVEPYATNQDTESLSASASAHMPRYLAVNVPMQGVAEERKGKSTVMLWDTRRNQLVTDYVYVLKRELQEGKTVKIAGVSAHVAAAE